MKDNLNHFQNEQISHHSGLSASACAAVDRRSLQQSQRQTKKQTSCRCSLGYFWPHSGYVNDENVEIVNSYAIPFEEDPSQSSIWFLDHLYHESMFDMMKKVSFKSRRSVKRRSSSVGTPLETLSKLTTLR